MKHFELSTQPRIKAELNAAIEGYLEKEKSFEIYEHKFFPVTIWAGPVPVVFVPRLTVDCTISMEGEVELSAKLVKLDYSFVFGVDYTKGSKPNAFSKNTSKPAKYFEDIQFDLNGEVKVKPKVAFDYGLYGAAFVGISGGLYARLDGIAGGYIGANVSVNAELSFHCGLEFNIQASLEFLGKTIAELDVNILTFNWLIWKRTWDWDTTPTGTVITPAANPPAGTYNGAQYVSLVTGTQGAKIYYTTTGNEPTTSSSGRLPYSNPIRIFTTTTLKAIAVKDGMDDSAVLTVDYIITDLVTDPTLGNYTIGDTGLSGGIIFYRSETGFTLYQNATDTVGIKAHYLEAAPVNMPTFLTWASSGYITTDIFGTGTAIGTGRKNTALILATDADAPAAKACYEYRYNGDSDWFLPSKDELNQLYMNRSYVGNMGTNIYWTSYQNGKNVGMIQFFSSGTSSNSSKDATNVNVRAIRAF